MSVAVLYHWWAEPSDQKPAHNLRSSLIHSIATLRGVNKTVPIYVLDLTEFPQDYQDLPNKLNFSPVRWRPHLTDYKDKAGWRNLSRLFDLEEFSRNINENIIIYSDTDVFYLRDPLPLNQNPDKFSFNGSNSGFFYFNKTAQCVRRFFEVFKAYTISSLNDENFRIITRSYTDYNEWYYVLDETILTYMCFKIPELFNIISINEHLTPGTIKDPEEPFTGVKTIHSHGTTVENKTETESWRRQYARGLTALLIKELYNNVCQAIDPKEIYTEQQLKYHLPLQTTLSQEFIKLVLTTRQANGHFNLLNAIEQNICKNTLL